MQATSIRLRALVLPVALALRVQAGNEAVPTVAHRVVTGDTLWDLATELTDQGGDVRATVRTIQEINDLDGGLIQVGELLLLPAA